MLPAFCRLPFAMLSFAMLPSVLWHFAIRLMPSCHAPLTSESIQQASQSRATSFMQVTELTDEEYKKFCELIYRVAGIRIADNKRVMVTNRVRRRLRATGIKTFAEYYAFLTSPAGGDEMPLFLDAITTNETYFYRDHQHYDWLGQTFLPEIVAASRGGNGPRFCGSGRRLAAPARSPIRSRSRCWQSRHAVLGLENQPLGTDLSGAVLASARAGSYDERAVRLVNPDDASGTSRKMPAAKRWTVKNEVRSTGHLEAAQPALATEGRTV